jgi:hypothetical protein
MTRPTRIAATALAVAMVAPAAAFSAAQLDLQGAATLRQIADDRARVTFAVDNRIAGKHKGAVEFAGDERAAIRPDGRHGDDYRYRAIVESDDLEAGKRYRVRIEARGHKAKTLKLKLIDRR